MKAGFERRSRRRREASKKDDLLGAGSGETKQQGEDDLFVVRLTASAKRGIKEAQYQLALLHEKGRRGVEVDLEAAAFWYEKAGDKGSVRALCNLGRLRMSGRAGVGGCGVADEGAAFQCFLQAAEMGDTKARHNAAMCYKDGTGVAVANDKAAAFFRAAGADGYSKAQYQLAVMLDQGVRVEADPAEAAALYRSAAEEGGDPRAWCNLGVLYEGGRGVEQSDAQARACFQAAADLGDENGMTNIAMLAKKASGEGMGGTDEDIVRNLTAASQRGEPRAQFNLAIIYEKGKRGVEEDLKEARRLYRLSAKQGDARGHYNLALMYAEGRGVPENQKVRWM